MAQLFEKLASAIRNDVVSGLRGYHHNMSMSIEQLQDEVVDCRLQIIKEYTLKGIIPLNDLVLAINCIDVDCKDLERCSLCKGNGDDCTTPVAHFEIPLLILDFGFMPIVYLGTTDRMNPFICYTSPQAFNYQKYRRRKKSKPYVYIDTAPNENGMLDCFIFNSPLLKQVSIVAVFKDPRQLEQYGCCLELSDDNFSFLNAEIKKRLTEQKIRYYRNLLAPILPNNLMFAPG